jgi:hypothetical protein
MDLSGPQDCGISLDVVMHATLRPHRIQVLLVISGDLASMSAPYASTGACCGSLS